MDFCLGARARVNRYILYIYGSVIGLLRASSSSFCMCREEKVGRIVRRDER